MYFLGILKGENLKKRSKGFQEKHFGKNRIHNYNIIRSIHKSVVEPNNLINL